MMDLDKRTLSSGRYGVTLLALILISSLTLVSAPKAEASPDEVKLTTTFPHLVIGGGESLSRPITIKNLSGSDRRLDLSVDAPAGWTTSLQSAGVRVRSIYLAGDGEHDVMLNISPSPAENAGIYDVNVRASRGGNVLASLTILVEVEPTAGGEIQLATKYPKMEGPPGKDMEYKIDIKNRGSRKSIDYRVNVPEGWKTSISPEWEKKEIRSQAFDPGEEKAVALTITPPSSAEPGEYPVEFVASSEGARGSLDLLVDIPGTYELDFTTKSGRLNADVTRGGRTIIQLALTNKGTAALGDIEFDTGWNLPSGWTASFEPKVVRVVEPGSSTPVGLMLEPASDAIPGDYSFEVKATARTPYKRSDSFDLRVTVSPGTSWGFIGIGIVVAILLGLFFLFLRLGRR